MTASGFLNLIFFDQLADAGQAALRRWRTRREARERLARMAERDLRDLGISPAQAVYETAKPFWKA
jgi:uncharacterized protein YjiS (DUF1127 family)